MNDNKSTAELKASFRVVFIGQVFNLNDKGDRFGQHLDLSVGSTQRRYHFAEWGIMKPSTTDRGDL